MPRPTNRVLKALERAGWSLRATSPGGGHHILVHPNFPGIVAVPRHPMTRKKTLGKIIKQAGLTLPEFEKLFR
ncbi:MAG: type II toxin-antitoxin system HicA family toxin [Planctomycetaceae bacterium]|nr:type II toxin-antitoxin system HicA family toxin [Planctomycetaceae bacterium]